METSYLLHFGIRVVLLMIEFLGLLGGDLAILLVFFLVILFCLLFLSIP